MRKTKKKSEVKVFSKIVESKNVERKGDLLREI